MAKFKTHYEDCDILVVGGGMAGTGATFEVVVSSGAAITVVSASF